MKKTTVLILLLLAAIMTLSCCKKQEFSASRTEFLFDTVITLDFTGESENAVTQAINGCMAEFGELEMVFSPTDQSSELYRLNLTAAKEPFKASEELYGCIKAALGYCELSGGALDISLGRLISLWGIGSENAAVPDIADINAVKGASREFILLDDENRTVRFTDDRVQINLGAVAKGYAAAKAEKIAREAGVRGIINIGGSITSVGFGEKQYKIGIADPKSPGDIIGTVTVSDGAVATSGDYQRFFEADGKRYHHIFDGKTGFPAESDISGVTVICGDPFAADCLSTAVFVLGSKDGLELIEAVGGAEAVIICSDGEIILSSGADKYSFTR